MKNTPRINRSKLVALGREKILHACSVHAGEMRKFRPFDRRHKLHQGLLAQCVLAFNDICSR